VSENEVLTKFELMDGAPVKGEVVPIRFFLASTDLTPSYKNVNNRFSCKYILNLVLIDEEDRRYFKQQDIELWRKKV
jgi:vacuolar protein sorting-associated protein 26